MANSNIALLLASVLISALCAAEEESVPSTIVPIRMVRNTSTDQCEVLVNHSPVLKVDCYPVTFLPRVLANYSGGFGSLQQVLVFQELTDGNACNGGPLHILAIAAHKKPLVADPIDYCGGPDPLISRKGKTLIITLPGRHPNHPIDSTVWIPTEKWSYKEGLLTRIK